MRDDAYKKLAEKLHQLPNGFPSTPGGVEIRILKKIFSPEDAALALKLRMIPETAPAIARRLHRTPESLQRQLNQMAEKGQIASILINGEKKYVLMPFIIGIYEFQLKRLDKELADLFEEYLPTLMPVLGGSKPALARVIPVHATIDPGTEILTYENLRALVLQSRSFGVNTCICRKERALQGHPCRHPLETCMTFSREAHALEKNNPLSARILTQDEALRLLDTVAQEGLVHATYNVRDDFMFVCNCCACCCGMLRGMREFHAPHLLARSNFMAAMDAGACTHCGLCAEERCPVEAILSTGGAYAIAGERCIGCGACATGCPANAITLIRRPQMEQWMPSKDIVNWSLERLSHRSGLLKRLALNAVASWRDR